MLRLVLFFSVMIKCVCALIKLNTSALNDKGLKGITLNCILIKKKPLHSLVVAQQSLSSVTHYISILWTADWIYSKLGAGESLTLGVKLT